MTAPAAAAVGWKTPVSRANPHLSPGRLLVQTKQKRALWLMFAMGAVSCGGPMQPGDAYQGVIDGTGLDSKFQTPSTCGTSGRDKCPYQPVKAYAGMKASSRDVPGTEFSFYNFGLLSKSDKLLLTDNEQRLVLPTSAIKGTTHDFTESCATDKEFDLRTDAYREDVQYPVFDTLPLATTSSTAPSVLPLVKRMSWTGVSQYTCNAIKDATSLTDGDFGGVAQDEAFALRAVIDMTVTFKSLSDTSSFAPLPGWYRGLQFVYLDGGAVPVEDVQIGTGDTAKTVQAVKMMDGVWLKPSSSSAKPTDANAKLVFQARPGDADWSPVVRLREYTAPSSTTTYKSLCYQAPDCAVDSIDMSKATTAGGVLFLVSAPQ
jgi:hypothetical protein